METFSQKKIWALLKEQTLVLWKALCKSHFHTKLHLLILRNKQTFGDALSYSCFLDVKVVVEDLKKKWLHVVEKDFWSIRMCTLAQQKMK